MTSERETIRFAKDLSFPIDLITQRIAIMGTSGGGKTYGAGVLVEGMADAGAQVVVVDGIGIWYGLRLAKDGKRKGLSIPVFGGEHGDIPLEPTSGALIAKLVAEKRMSMVLDVSDMNGAEQRRFVTEFAVALHKLKKSNRSAVMVVWEECQDFVPQRVSGESARMVGAMEKLIKQGRNYGIGTTLISQRPQAVNKDCLNQCGVLLAFQTVGPHERKAVKDWVVHNGVEQMTQLNELPSLPVGTCFVWSPAWLKVFLRVRVLEKRTLDTSKAPEFGDVAATYELPPVEMEELRKEMAATIEKAKADDPKLLRAEVASLKKQLAAAGNVKVETKTVEVPILTDKDRKALGSACDRLDAIAGWFADANKVLGEAAAGIRATLSPLGAVAAKPSNSRSFADQLHRSAGISRRDAREIAGLPVKRNAQADASVDGALTGPERKLLTALAQHGRMSKTKLAVLTGYSQQGGGFRNPLGRLRTREFVEYLGGDDVQATDLGIQELGEFEPLPTGAALLEQWLGQLSGPESKILRALAEAYPKALDAETLAERTGYAADGGGFRNPLGRLRTLELVTRGQGIRASDALFGDGQ